MNRDEVYNKCHEILKTHDSILLELPTGFGKTKLSIELVNLLARRHKKEATSVLILVAKRIHKQTWKEEIKKWGGMDIDNIVFDCYESMKHHVGKHYTFLLMDEVHHVKSDARTRLLGTIKFDHMIGLSATIPKSFRIYLANKYKVGIISCDLTEAIEDEVLPEPRILLMPLMLNSVVPTELWELNPKKGGKTYHGSYIDIWKYRKMKVHALIACTQKQYLNELNSLIAWEKNAYFTKNDLRMQKMWLYHCGKRLEFLSDCKVPVIQSILRHLDNERTITFCKSIEQCTELGENCIHSQNSKANEIYNNFNAKEINHITAVNILNENANLVDCKYAVFCNLSSSSIVIPQRLGRSLRHKSPVIVVPYYQGTREEEIVKKMFENYNQGFIKVIYSTNDITL